MQNKPNLAEDLAYALNRDRQNGDLIDTEAVRRATERITWANYGETQPVPNNDEPPEPNLT